MSPVFRWDNGQLIPGTEAITPGPGVQLNDRELAFARLGGVIGIDLTDANLANSNLTSANLYSSTLTNANLSRANLTNAGLDSAILTNTNLTGSVVARAIFTATTSHGFTKAQLYSTASYQQKNLQGIVLAENDLTGWDFSGQDLTDAFLGFATLTDANFSEALVAGVNFEEATSRGFTPEQLYSTASYQQKNLRGISLASYEGLNDLSGWDFSGQDLTNANLTQSRLINVNLSNAVVAGARFQNTTGQGLIKEQLYSTASYQQKNLQGIDLHNNDLTGWDLSGQDLTHANLSYSRMTNTNLSGAVVERTDFGAPWRGITKEQLYSTASYQHNNLQGIGLWRSNLTGWDFRGQNLTNAFLLESNLTSANLSGAKLDSAYFHRAIGFDSALFDPETVYDQWTVFPPGFDPVARGLTFKPSPLGDLNGNDLLDVADMELLREAVRGFAHGNQSRFDVDQNGRIDLADHHTWVKDLKRTWYGDANLDGEFNSTDLVNVFQAAQYEDRFSYNSTWSTGDWNADGDFTTSDLVVAFQDGGYEQGPRVAVTAVPEPSSGLLNVLALAGLLVVRRPVRKAGRCVACSRVAQTALIAALRTAHIPRSIIACGLSVTATSSILAQPPDGHFQTSTWSIVAADPATGDVGVAAASCPPSFIPYADGVAALVPGKGASATQANVTLSKRNKVFQLLQEGRSAEDIIQTVTDPAYDANARNLQYGVVTLNNGMVEAVAFTGASNDPWAGAQTDVGLGVTVQGNTLARLPAKVNHPSRTVL